MKNGQQLRDAKITNSGHLDCLSIYFEFLVETVEMVNEGAFDEGEHYQSN